MGAPRWVEIGWGVFALANLYAMVRWESWETIPFHFIWVSLTLVYGFRPWPLPAMIAVLSGVALTTGFFIAVDVRHGSQEMGEFTEVPLMSAMFLAMVWHARRRQQALNQLEVVADQRASLLERQARFLHDASHELRTPVTIARGHLDLLDATELPEVAVAAEELGRMERILERLLLLANADQTDFVVHDDVDTQSFLEDVFLRWSEVAPRVWRLGRLAAGTLRADQEALRIALDALLENAVKYTTDQAAIEIASEVVGGSLVIEVADEGCGIPEEALARIFERFARADAARSRSRGGVGLGLAIVDAIAKAHGGRCDVRSSAAGTTFSLVLPRFTPAPGRRETATPRSLAAALAVSTPVDESWSPS